MISDAVRNGLLFKNGLLRPWLITELNILMGRGPRRGTGTAFRPIFGIHIFFAAVGKVLGYPPLTGSDEQ
jgi:hypothetical protein